MRVAMTFLWMSDPIPAMGCRRILQMLLPVAYGFLFHRCFSFIVYVFIESLYIVSLHLNHCWQYKNIFFVDIVSPVCLRCL
jgi:predicted membrane chloride channel (bestrophin family)